MSAVQGAVAGALGTAREAVAPTPPREPDDWLKESEVEEMQPDEEAKITQIGETMRKMVQHNFDVHQHHFRGTHVKTLAIANEPSFILPDTARAPRGLGLKIFNVPGEQLEGGVYSGDTQDVMFNNSPQIELTDVTTCLEIVQLREKYFDSLVALQAQLALRNDRLKQFAPSMLPNVHVIGAELFTQSSFAYGPYAAHFSLVPIDPVQAELGTQSIPVDASPIYHRQDLHDYYASRTAKYTLRAQFASDLSKHPVEDSSVEWDESTAPWHDLATLTFASQETMSDARRVWWENTIALRPWNGLKAHRPLGSINRLRKRVYDHVREFRSKGNQKEVKFPKSADEMPA